jgi:hypothetical protein
VPVTHGVAGSSPVRTARGFKPFKFNYLEGFLFFVGFTCLLFHQFDLWWLDKYPEIFYFTFCQSIATPDKANKQNGPLSFEASR